MSLSYGQQSFLSPEEALLGQPLQRLDSITSSISKLLGCSKQALAAASSTDKQRQPD
jgi:hypothetical protein